MPRGHAYSCEQLFLGNKRMVRQELSFGSRKALSVHLCESAGSELGELIQQLLDRVEQLERTKVDVTPIVPLELATASSDSNSPTS